LFKNELCYFPNRPSGASYTVFSGALVPAGTVLVTPVPDPIRTSYKVLTLIIGPFR
jgi:hypothetical protein